VTPERWRQVEQLYHSALDRGAAERSRLLDQACGGDETLRREVESLLAFDTPSGNFMDTPPGGMVPGLPVEERTRSIAGRILGRYRILSPLGRGGMGEVFLAEDTDLHRKVAVKLLRPAFTRDYQQVQRFKQEAHSASALNHPNIVTIFEIGEVDECHFIATEFVDGPSLQERMSTGRLTLPEALDIGVQVAGALNAAHHAAIVHRDVKPANIMLRRDGYVKVVDFGLAKLMETNSGESEPLVNEQVRTEQGCVMGTPRYMSPEQVLADRLDGRSDIFSLGVVLYEMICGRPPFQGATISELVREILTREVPPLRFGSDGAFPVLDQIVGKALAKDREQRYQTAGELQADLSNLKLDIELERKRPRSRRPLARLIALALALLVALPAGYYVYAGRKGSPPAARVSLAPANLRRSIVVMGFKNLAGRSQADWVSTALSEWFAAELAAGEKLRIIPGDTVARMRVDLSLSAADSYAALALARVQKYLHADYVLAGTYFDLGGEPGGEVRLDLLLQDGATGKTLTSTTATSTESELPLLVSRACPQLRQALGIGTLSAAEAESLRGLTLSDSEASRTYSEGLEKLWEFHVVSAKSLLEKSVAGEQAYAPSRSALSTAWSAMGYESKALDEAKKAMELSASLSREARWAIEGRYREMHKEWGQAIETYRKLWRLFPDNLEYAIRLARAQTKADKAKESLSTVEELRRLPPPERDDPRIDLSEALAAAALPDFKRQQAAAEAAADKAGKQGIRLLAGEARSLEGDALAHSGETVLAIAAYEKAKAIYDAAGDRRSVADCDEKISPLLRGKGDVARSMQVLGESLAIRRASGDEAGTAGTLRTIAFLMVDQGDLRRAKALTDESLQTYTRIGDRRGYGAALNVLARISKHEGNLIAGRDQYLEALAIFRETGPKGAIAPLLNNIGELLSQQGDLSGAGKMLEESRQGYLALGKKEGAAASSEALGDVLMAQGDLGEARKRYNEALLLYNQAGAGLNVHDSLLHLAKLSMEDGRPAEAGNAARNAAEALKTAKQTDSAASGYAILSQALCFQGNLTEARQAIQQAVSLSAKSQGREIHLEVRIAAARVHAASLIPADVARATRDLNDALREARQFGFMRYRFDATLALGEIELKSGNAARGRERLAALAKEAETSGFGLISRKASAAAGKIP
jgi:tetratricopeptide (TPR) repeat protein